MNTFGKRLQWLIESKKLSQQTIADGTGINRSRISELQNDKVENPRISTIEKLAHYLECSPTWLRLGTGDIFDEEKKDLKKAENIPAGRRLEYLKGDMTVERFAQKCNIPEKTMLVYLNGERMSNEDCYKVAKAFNASLGWLTCGEAWQSSQKKYTGFSMEKHKETAENLRISERFFEKLSSDLEFSYPLTGTLHRPLQENLICLKSIRNLKSHLEENLFQDHKETATTAIYYDVDKRLEEKEKHNGKDYAAHLINTMSEEKMEEAITLLLELKRK